MIGLWSWTEREWTWLTYLEPKKFMIVSERGSYFEQVNVSDRGSWKMWTFPSLVVDKNSPKYHYKKNSLVNSYPLTYILNLVVLLQILWNIIKPQNKNLYRIFVHFEKTIHQNFLLLKGKFHGWNREKKIEVN